MGKIEELLNRIYDRNPDNGNYKIEVSLQNYAEIFNDWDHAPYKRKDIDPELLCFLADSIDDIPMKYNIDMCFYITEEARNTDRESLIVSWFKTFYDFYVAIEKSKMAAIMRKAIVYLVVSVALFILSYFSVADSKNIVAYILKEIIIVGGWVFLWEAISQITFERQGIGKLVKNYKRFARADIYFRYSKPSGPDIPPL